jgi:hypothetical protein
MPDYPPSDQKIVGLIRSYVAHRRRQRPSADLEERAMARAFAGRGARGRRALATGVVSMAAAASIIVGVAAVHSHLTASTAPPSTTSAPAQAPTPYPGKPTPSGAIPTPLPAATVACALADLEVESSSGGAYHGDAVVSILFTNTSSTACYIAGTPSAIQLTLSSGVVESVALGQAMTPTVTVEPGQLAGLSFGSSAMCSSEPLPAQPTSMIVTLANGAAWTITEAMNVGCGAPSVVVPLAASAGTPPTPGPATATSPAVVAGVPSSAS